MAKAAVETNSSNMIKSGRYLISLAPMALIVLTRLADPDFHVLADIAKLMVDDGLDWATAVCVALAKLCEVRA